MKNLITRVSGLAILLMLAGRIPMIAQQTPANSVTLPVTGTFAKGGDFVGTATINRFEQRNNAIVAIGFVRGVLSRGNTPLGSALAGEVVWKVDVSVNLASALAGVSARAPSTAKLTRIAWSPGLRGGARLVPVQGTSGCGVLNISLGATDVNLLGLDVALNPVGLSITGQSGTPLGDLVCAVSNLLGNVAGLVNLLNSLLGSLTGLLGGLGL